MKTQVNSTEVGEQSLPVFSIQTYDNNAFSDAERLRSGKLDVAQGDEKTRWKHRDFPEGNQLPDSPKDKRLLARLRRKAWLLPLMHFQFWTSAAFSLIQPFYPALAASAGLEAWKYGFVFSTYKMAMLIASLSADRLMALIHPLKISLYAVVGFFIFSLVFGALYWSPGGNTLLGLSLALVLLGGFTHVLYLVTVYSIVTSRFPGSPGVLIATFECVWGVGNMVGSIIGGALIDIWAFPLPFFVTGTIMILALPFIAKGSDAPGQKPNAPPETKSGGNSQSNPKLRRLLWDPIFLIDIVTVMLCWVIMGFNEPTLEPYLRQFDLTSTEVGVVYMVQFSSYAFGAVASGLFCHFQMESFFSFAGQLMTAIAYLILGPAPFIPTSPSLWMIYISQVLTGVGMSAQFICSYCHALKHVTTRGYPDDVRTSGFVSSVVFTLLVFGAMTSPPIAGVLVDVFGYRKGSMFLFAVLLVWTPVTLFQWLRSVCSTSSKIRVTMAQA
ncbi:multidrug resistance protein MdtG [Ixodes scapularis]